MSEPYRHRCPACRAWLLPVWTSRTGEQLRTCPCCGHVDEPESFRPAPPPVGDDELDSGSFGPSIDETEAFRQDAEQLL